MDILVHLDLWEEGKQFLYGSNGCDWLTFSGKLAINAACHAAGIAYRAAKLSRMYLDE
jgi:hypothetical protein